MIRTWSTVSSSADGGHTVLSDHTATTVDGRLADIDSLNEEIGHLRTALTSRVVIDEAKGMLMLSFGLSDEAAFALLSRLSQETNTKVRVIAQCLVDTGRFKGRLDGSSLGDLGRGHGVLPADQAAGTAPAYGRADHPKRPSGLLR